MVFLKPSLVYVPKVNRMRRGYKEANFVQLENGTKSSTHRRQIFPNRIIKYLKLNPPDHLEV